MINVDFFIEKTQNFCNIVAFKVLGHAFFDEYGKDIVCAAVSSSIFMVINGITEVLKVKAKINIKKNKHIYVGIPKESVHACQKILRILELHLVNLKCQYSGFLNLRYLEV